MRASVSNGRVHPCGEGRDPPPSIGSSETRCKENLNFYYEELYGLHSQEFTLYKKGVLTQEPYLHWLRHRWTVYKANEKTEETQWKRISRLHNAEFVGFMQRILTAPDENDLDKILAGVKVQKPN